MTKVFGYFDNAEQIIPAFDPGLNVLCPVCMLVLSPPIVTVDLFKPGDSRSYFYRVHKECSKDSKGIGVIESSLIDSI